MIVDIIYGFLFILGGMLLLKYRKTVRSWTGNFMWAERYIGNGGTYVVLICVGLFAIFLGIIYPFGGLDLLFGSNNSIK